MITDPKKPISKLSKLCRNNDNKFIKKAMLIGYSNDKLINYLTDYVISVAKVDSSVCKCYVKQSLQIYNNFPNDVYCVFTIRYIANHITHLSTFDVDVESFECYDDAYAFIANGISQEVTHKDKIMYVMSYKLDDAVCDAIHKEIHELTSLTRVNFKPSNHCIKLWVAVPEDLTWDAVQERIIKLEKNNTKESIIKATYNEPGIRSMVINVNNYRLLSRLKLTQPWVFKDVYKIDYGMKAVKQKLEDSNVERLS